MVTVFFGNEYFCTSVDDHVSARRCVFRNQSPYTFLFIRAEPISGKSGLEIGLKINSIANFHD
jgi:hypothetical protein